MELFSIRIQRTFQLVSTVLTPLMVIRVVIMLLFRWLKMY